MNAIGIGIDLIEIDRIQNAIEKWGDRFTHRIFTDNEIEYCRSHADHDQKFAARFAAKEAILKALGTGLSNGISWREIELRSLPNGKPIIELTGQAKRIADSLCVSRIFVSLSHTKTHAIANVLLVGETP